MPITYDPSLVFTFFFHHGNTTCTSPRKLKFCMHNQFNPTSPEMEKKGSASLPEFPWLAILLLLAISQPFQVAF